MKIELENSIINFVFQHCQIEITGKCNMRCKHCRAWEESKVNMPLWLFKKSINFATSESDKNFRLTISGGEPFIHPNLIQMLTYAKKGGIEDIIITTNGSLVTKEKLQDLKKIGIKNLVIQISVDSIHPKKHDKFRNFDGAFDKAMRAFDYAKEVGINSSLRASITPDRINEVELLAELAIKKGAIRLGIGSVIPAGRGKTNKSLLMNSKKKEHFLRNIIICKRKYPNLDVTTEDPLKFALENCPWDYGEFDIQKEGFFGGCSAGISGFNVDSTGVITPCAVLFKKIVDLSKTNIKKAKEVYVNSEVVKNLFNRDFKGKCSNCDLKRLCGGCRAVAEGMTGNYLGEDTTCFYKKKCTN